jgi:hypothetical protein
MADISSLIEDARSFAASANEAAISLVGQAEAAIGSFSDGGYFDGGKTPSAPQVFLAAPLPEFIDPPFQIDQEPKISQNLAQLPVFNAPTAPVNSAVRPNLSDPSAPAPLRGIGVSAPSVVTSFAFPSVPGPLQDINVTAPTLTAVTLPDRPTSQLPVFGSVAPTADLTPPADLEAQFNAAYRSIGPTMVAALDNQLTNFLHRYNPRYQEQLNALEDQLAKYLQGGTALSPAVENAIYERSKDKVSAEFRRARDTAFTDGARRGFSMPDGAVFSATQQARQAGADANARAAVEIAVKQAELEQQNIQFAVTTSAQLRNAAMSASISYHGNLVQINGQALDYGKTVLNAAVQVYDLLVKAFQTRLEAYKADAQVYETRIRAASLAIEIYKAEIAGVEAQVRVDLAKVDIYKARLEALNVLSSVYRNQIEAVVSQANIEKLKIELYGAQVQAYAVEAQAKASEYQGYAALINGQEAKLRAYSEDVRAYVANVEGYKALIAAKQTEIEAVATVNRSILGQYTASVEGYKAIVGARAQVASTTIEYQKVKLLGYSARVQRDEAVARLSQEYYKTAAQLGIENTKVVLQSSIESAKVATARTEAVAQTAIAGARVYEGLASAALSGMNTLVTQSGTQ